MTSSSSFLTGSDLDELFELIDGGYLDNDEEISKELETLVSELPSEVFARLCLQSLQQGVQIKLWFD